MKLLEHYFSDEEKTVISDEIKKAELKTSGEIRVYFERYTHGLSPQDRAVEIFSRLGMHKTKLHNGVLFYIAFNDRKFAVIGDYSIHHKVPTSFWADIADAMKGYFARDEYIEGLAKGIREVGDQLKHYFPIREDDINELPNEIAFEKDLQDEEE